MRAATFYFLLLLTLSCNVCIAQKLPPAKLPSLITNDAVQDYSFTSILKPGEDPAEKIKKGMFIKVTASKTSCFVGEPILVTYYLYSSLQSQSRMAKHPVFNGCSVIEMTRDEPYEVTKIGDKMYRTILLRRVQLVPLQIGDLEAGVTSTDNEVLFSTSENPYDLKRYTATVSSEPLHIEVKALPEKLKPEHFTGVIGHYNISAKVDSSVIAKGENNHFEISITGEGNLQGISLPSINWPAGTEHFDASDSQRIDKLSFPLESSATFDIPFIATKEGKINLPQVSFNYFNPETATYETAQTNDIVITVTHANATSNNAAIVKEDVTNDKYLWIVPAIALTVAFGWLVTRKKQKKNPAKQANVQPANAVATPIEQPEEPVAPEEKISFEDDLLRLQAVADNREFFSQAKVLLTAALQNKLQTQTNSEALLAALVLQKTNDVNLRAKVETIFKTCNLSLYSPIVAEDVRTTTYEQLTEVINALQQA